MYNIEIVLDYRSTRKYSYFQSPQHAIGFVQSWHGTDSITSYKITFETPISIQEICDRLDAVKAFG